MVKEGEGLEDLEETFLDLERRQREEIRSN